TPPEDKVDWKYVQNLLRMSDTALAEWWRTSTPEVHRRVAAELRAHLRSDRGADKEAIRAFAGKLAKFEDDDKAAIAVAAFKGTTRDDMKKELLARKASDPNWEAKYVEALRLFARATGGGRLERELDQALRELINEGKITRSNLVHLVA